MAQNKCFEERLLLTIIKILILIILILIVISFLIIAPYIARKLDFTLSSNIYSYHQNDSHHDHSSPKHPYFGYNDTSPKSTLANLRTSPKYSKPESTETLYISTQVPEDGTTLETEDFKNHAYFSICLEFLLTLIITKNPDHVTAVVRNSKNVFEKLLLSGRFKWLGKYMTQIVRNILKSLSDFPYERYKGAVEVFYNEIITRRKTYRASTNALFDMADNLVKKKDAEDVFNALSLFRNYPEAKSFNATREGGYVITVKYNGTAICFYILDAFNILFVNIKDRKKLQQLSKLADEAAARRFPYLMNTKGPKTEILNDRQTAVAQVDKFLGKLLDKLKKGVGVVKKIIENILSSEDSKQTIAGTRPVGPPEYGLPLSELLKITTPVPTKFFQETEPTTVSSRQMIEEHGYLSYAWHRLWLQIRWKKPEIVEAVTQHAKTILKKKDGDGQLEWMGTALKKLVMGIASAFTDISFDQITGGALDLSEDILNRQKTYSPEVNKLINYAESLIKKEDGEYLIDVIKKFEKYPEGSYKTEEEMCQNIIDAFERPFLKSPKGAAILKDMVENSVDKWTLDESDLADY